jgi:large subunit ribosomal protein L17
MPHNVFGKKLSRDTGQRQALLKGLAGALIRSEAIETTEAKAEAARGLIEKLITHARKGSVTDLRQIEEVIVDHDLIHKLVHDIAPRFAGRNGGYLRLIKLGNRTGDNAPMVRMEFVSAAEIKNVEPPAAPAEKAPVTKPAVKKAAAPKKAKK